jgi:hypothetical protein
MLPLTVRGIKDGIDDISVFGLIQTAYKDTLAN